MSKSLAACLLALLAGSCSAQSPFERSWPLAAELIGAQLSAPQCFPAEITSLQRQPLASALGHVDESDLSDATKLTPIDYAVIADDVPSIKRFMALGYSLSSRDIHESTPLHGAVLNGSRRALRFLLENGVDTNAGNSIGATPLMVAAEWNRIDMARTLVSFGASAKTRTTDGLTALHYAIPCKDQSMIDLLLANGAESDAKALEMASKFNVRVDGHER